MSAEQKFRIYFGKRPATEEELSHIEEITVDQEMDLAWQATIKFFLCLDESGKWSHLEDDFLKSFARVRLELQLGSANWVPLIDGPIVARHAEMDSQPGRSNITLTVNDDSVLLNREEAIEPEPDLTDDELAGQLFHTVPEIAETDIESTPARSDSLPPTPLRRGTAMQQLRDLARRHEFHAFVLPGDKPGESIGCFLPDPTGNGGLPELVLLGADRNLSTLQVTDDAQAPARFRARSLSIRDKQFVSRSSRLQDIDLLGPSSTQPQNETPSQLLPPAQNNEDDPDRAVQAATRRRSYSVRATGRVLPGCYVGILRPYQIVSIRAGTTKSSGKYLLTKATHRITPSLYSQEFRAKRNAAEETSATPALLGKIV